MLLIKERPTISVGVIADSAVTPTVIVVRALVLNIFLCMIVNFSSSFLVVIIKFQVAMIIS